MNSAALTPLQELQSRFAIPGRVERILLRPSRGADMVEVTEARLSESGLNGDRARAGKRAVTLIQYEHLPVIASLAGLDFIDPSVLRRNIVVSGLNIASFRGKRLMIGDAAIELTVPCHPCSRMERAIGHGGYTAMRGHGGMCAQVRVEGQVAVGSPILPSEN